MKTTMFMSGMLALSMGVFAQTASESLPTDTVHTASLLIGEWHFIHVLGPDGKVTDKVDRSQGPNGEMSMVNANGPDISILTNGTYEKRYTPENKDIGYWRVKQPNEVSYTMVVPINSQQGRMLGFAARMFNKPTSTDGKGNYLDTSTDTSYCSQHRRCKSEKETTSMSTGRIDWHLMDAIIRSAGHPSGRQAPAMREPA